VADSPTPYLDAWHFLSRILVTTLALAAVRTGAFAQSFPLYAVDQTNNDILQFDSLGNASTFGSDGAPQYSPASLAFDRAGNLYVANYGGEGNIEKFSVSNGVLSGSGSVFASIDQATALAFDSSGNLYATVIGGGVGGDGTIVKFAFSGGTLSNTPTGFADSDGVNPQGLAFDMSGNLYVTNENSDNIILYPYSDGTLSNGGELFTTSGLSIPQGLAFDQVGDLYVANRSNDYNGVAGIEEFAASDGTPSTTGTMFEYANPTGHDPLDLAFDRSGDLYAGFAGATQGIDEYTETDGVLSNTASQFADDSSGTSLNGIAFSPGVVPEPGSAILAGIGGLAMLGLYRLRARTIAAR
jgi:6-phosphogluconolactonase (cycloisomerase 2 family)